VERKRGRKQKQAEEEENGAGEFHLPFPLRRKAGNSDRTRSLDLYLPSRVRGDSKAQRKREWGVRKANYEVRQTSSCPSSFPLSSFHSPKFVKTPWGENDKTKPRHFKGRKVAQSSIPFSMIRVSQIVQEVPSPVAPL